MIADPIGSETMNMKKMGVIALALLALAAVPAATAETSEEQQVSPCGDAGSQSGGTGSATQAEFDPDLTGPEVGLYVDYWDNTYYVWVNPANCISAN